MANVDQKINISCPFCKKDFPVDEAIKNQLVENITKEAKEKIKQKEDTLLKQENELMIKQKNLLKQESDFDVKLKSEVEKNIKNEKIKIKEEEKKKAEERLQVELKDKDEQIKEKDEALKEAQQAQLNALKREREAEEKIKNSDLEVEKRLKVEKDKLEDNISKRYSENFNLKEQEYQKKINDLSKQAEELKRKAEQGSQELQGEVQELDLENTLRIMFPQDIIEPIEKGIRGADVRQKVKSSSGKICGVILWESKRAKNWSDSWLLKLKENLRAESAHIPVIISTTLPEEAQSGFGQKDMVWICKPSLASAVATILRNQLLEVATASMVAKKQGTLADSLYEYITSHEFRQQVQAMVEVYQEMKNQILIERRAYEKSWKMRDAQLDKILNGTARIVGSIQGKLGTTAFGPVEGLELLGSGEENTIEQEGMVDETNNNISEDIPY